MTQLHEILAVEKGSNTKTNLEYTKAYRDMQVAGATEGLSKTYAPASETDPADSSRPPAQYAPDYKQVAVNIEDTLRRVTQVLTERFDLTATKDYANTQASADVVVDGVTLLSNVPVTYLLFLEKQCIELTDFITHIPTLDPTQRWSVDANTGLYTAEPITTNKTKKIEKVIVLYAATKEHPANVQLRPEDVLEGYWTTIRSSGAMTAVRKQELLDRVAAFSAAVKQARERANTLPVTQQHVAAPIFDYLFAPSAGAAG